MKKRLLALLLCLVMVIGLVPFALADGGEGSAEPNVKTTLHFCYLGGGTNTTQSLAVGEKQCNLQLPKKRDIRGMGNGGFTVPLHLTTM